jgi:hypothetical protein
VNSQNAITAAALVLAFLIFITVRGELPAYFGVLGLGSKAVTPKPDQTGFGFTSSYGSISTGTVTFPTGGGSVTIGGPGGSVSIPIGG